MAKLKEQALKQRVAKGYYTKVRPRSFQAGDLVLGQADVGVPGIRGKLAPTWKELFRGKETLEKGAYKLETLDSTEILRTWNVTHLKRYFP
ncbi:hypothetical protein AHAS_Ahas09G0170900 [Arachis hypogaea]